MLMLKRCPSLYASLQALRCEIQLHVRQCWRHSELRKSVEEVSDAPHAHDSSISGSYCPLKGTPWGYSEFQKWQLSSDHTATCMKQSQHCHGSTKRVRCGYMASFMHALCLWYRKGMGAGGQWSQAKKLSPFRSALPGSRHGFLVLLTPPRT